MPIRKKTYIMFDKYRKRNKERISMEKRISGHTGLLALIGSPVGHSGSPAMYNYSFEKLGLDYAYVAFDIKEDKVKDAIAAMKTFNMRGCNVTMPDKVEAAKYMDELSPAAQIIGAVNTIVNDNGKLTGHITDGSLEEGALLETVTAQVAVFSPSLVVAVIVAVPSATPVTLPASTVATFSSEELHVIVLSVASSGVIVADNVTDSPTLTVAVAGLTATADTAMVPTGLSSSLQDTVPNITANAHTEAQPFNRNLFIIITFCL